MEINTQNIRTLSFLGSCGTFGKIIEELATQNNNIITLTADLCSFAGLTRFAQNFPNQYYNVGIAEQNMVGIAAGMAKEGLIPFVTSYASFLTLRCADQINVNVGYMNLPIKLVGLTSGLSVGILGPTHICLNDVALMRAIPNLVIFSPADCIETAKCIEKASEINAPVYLRLTGTMGNPVVFKDDYNFEIGKAITLKDGSDIAIISTGTMVYNSLKAAKILEEKGLSVKVINMHTLKPLDVTAVKECCSCKLLVTVEEHSVIGGLGSAVAEVLSNIENSPKHLIIGTQDEYIHAGDYKYLLESYGLTPERISDRILEE